jgi:hypothetical protein
MCKHWGLGHINKNSLTSGKPCLENGELKYIRQSYRSPTLSTDTPCPEAERLDTTANVTPKTTNSNSVLPNTAWKSNTFISLEVQ